MCHGREEVWVWRPVTGKTCHGPGWALQLGKRWSREWAGLEEVGVVSPRGLQLPSHQRWEQDFCPGRCTLAVEKSWEAQNSRSCTPHLTGHRHIGWSCEGLTPDAGSCSAFCHRDPHPHSPFWSSTMVLRRGSEPADYL